ncbi:MAG: type II secretion system protein J [Planctomycetaceae bacterium]
MQRRSAFISFQRSMWERHAWTLRGCDVVEPRPLGSVGTRARRGMTLSELLISLTILSMMSVVLAGMSNAVQSAWSYTKGVEDCDVQAQAAIERIQYMISQTGVYDLAGQPTRVGMTVVQRSVGTTLIPDVLVLWTGGRSGGMAATGVQTRLPTVGELLIYTWNPSNPSQLIEIGFPGQTATFDFAASDLPTVVANLLSSSTAEKIPICENLRLSAMNSGGGNISIGNVRFVLTMTPSDTELATAAPQTTAWTQLNWPQGKFSSRSGMRQATLQIELQAEPDGIVRASDTVSAIPFFGSASQRHVYEP